MTENELRAELRATCARQEQLIKELESKLESQRDNLANADARNTPSHCPRCTTVAVLQDLMGVLLYSSPDDPERGMKLRHLRNRLRGPEDKS